MPRLTSRPRKAGSAPDPFDTQLRRLQRLVMQGELAATAVHEISNLQTIVLFNAGLLREEQRGQPDILRYVEPLLHAAGMVATLCNQLRNLARPVDPFPEQLDLAEVAFGTHRLLEQIIGRELDFKAPPSGPVTVLADRGQIEQMLINLVLNARDATDPDHGRIVVRVGGGRGREPWLEVADNGSGMTPEVKARLFEKFFTTKEPGRGTGLGMAMVQRLLEEMGGRIEVWSRVGRGTRIRLIFPRPGRAPALREGFTP